jgi:hypothetical protein
MSQQWSQEKELDIAPTCTVRAERLARASILLEQFSRVRRTQVSAYAEGWIE